jgi:DNA polymerase-3 subunit gamma/tau
MPTTSIAACLRISSQPPLTKESRAPELAKPTGPVRSADDDVDPDDPDANSAAIDTESLLSQTLGAKLIEEIKND